MVVRTAVFALLYVSIFAARNLTPLLLMAIPRTAFGVTPFSAVTTAFARSTLRASARGADGLPRAFAEPMTNGAGVIWQEILPSYAELSPLKITRLSAPILEELMIVSAMVVSLQMNEQAKSRMMPFAPALGSIRWFSLGQSRWKLP